MALKDMNETSPAEAPLISCPQAALPTESPLTKDDMHSAHEKLESVGLSGLDMNSCNVFEQCKRKMADLIVSYKDIFSRHHLDCGEARALYIAFTFLIPGHSDYHTDVCPQSVSEAAPSTE